MSCSCKIGEPCMTFPYNFHTPLSIEKVVILEESAGDVAIISGTLLAEGLSRNKNYYEIPEMKKIAESAIGVPIYFGTMTKTDPNTGLLVKNAHANIVENQVGEIIRTKLVKKLIKFWAKVANTPKFPTVIQEIKKGWGISIGGVAYGAKWIMKKIGNLKRMVLQIKDMVVNHVQLLSPSTKRGQSKAKVDAVQVQETEMIFGNPQTQPTNIHITLTQEGKQAYIVTGARLD